MEIIRNINEYHSFHPTVVSVGKFDGVHQGHMLLKKHMDGFADRGLASCMVTFDIPPSDGIAGGSSALLVTREEREAIVEKAGIDIFCVLHFDESLRRMPPEDFIRLLSEHLNMKALVCGSDFRFGYMGEGDTDLLTELAPKYDFELDVVSKLKDEKKDISSTLIRELITSGEIDHANRILGYEYFVYGQIVHGNRIGHSIGFPTINITPPSDKLLPPFGVYLTRVSIDNRSYMAITNVGCKPTVSSDGSIVVESHLLEGTGEEYGNFARVSFMHFLRKEKKFGSIDELKRQIQTDKKEALAYFKKA